MKNAASLLAFAGAVTGIVYLVVARHLFAHRAALVGVQVAAVLLMLWARMTFGRRSFHAAASTSQGGLVTSGPYAYRRHPIYASNLCFVWAGQFETPSSRALVATGVVTAGLVTRMLLEESFLRVAYPEYAAYARRAKRLIPFVI